MANTFTRVDLHTELRCPDCLALIHLVVSLIPKGKHSKKRCGEFRARVPKTWGKTVSRHVRKSKAPHPTFDLNPTVWPWR